ncbi:MAG: DUF4440 domain-containing protein [Ignavibacteria bacterium]|jgi:ketosteroid isomerase-like protein
MKKMIFILVVLLIGVIQLHPQDLTEVKATIEKNNSELAKLMVGDNFEEMLEYYSDEIISMPSYQPMLRGVNALVVAHNMQQESGVETTAFNLTTTDVMEAGDYFIEIGTYSITMTIPGMEMPWDDHGKYLNVWKWDDEGLLEIVVDIWNTDVNPWMEMQQMDNSDKNEEEN